MAPKELKLKKRQGNEVLRVLKNKCKDHKQKKVPYSSAPEFFSLLLECLIVAQKCKKQVLFLEQTVNKKYCTLCDIT